MTYAQITHEERYAISALRKLGYSCAAIARELQRAPSTISREVRRNAWRTDGRTYWVDKAQSYTNERRRVSRRNAQFTVEEWAFVEYWIREDWSPEQVVGWCKRFDLLAISHETIYRHIHADRERGGTLYTHLRVMSASFRNRTTSRTFLYGSSNGTPFHRSTITLLDEPIPIANRPGAASAIDATLWAIHAGARV